MYQYSDNNWISDTIEVSPVSFGQYIYYYHFNNLTVQKKSSGHSSLSSHIFVIQRSKWLRTCLLLCGDIHPCPGPDTFKNFKKRGLHFIHMNIRSLLPKIDEIRITAKKTNASCILLTETWLDDSIFYCEVNISNARIAAVMVAVSSSTYARNSLLTLEMISTIRSWRELLSIFYCQNLNLFYVVFYIDLRNKQTFMKY